MRGDAWAISACEGSLVALETRRQNVGRELRHEWGIQLRFSFHLL